MVLIGKLKDADCETHLEYADSVFSVTHVNSDGEETLDAISDNDIEYICIVDGDKLSTVTPGDYRAKSSQERLHSYADAYKLMSEILSNNAKWDEELANHEMKSTASVIKGIRHLADNIHLSDYLGGF